MPISVATNVRLLGQMYQDVARTALVNPAFAIGDPDLIEHGTDNSRAYQRVTGTKNMQMSGISRDSSGAVLGVCRVMIFRADDKSFVGETVSDGSGNWTFTMPNPNSGPFFLVEYKAGIPDVAGTSLNTLTPIEV